jgi:glycosyltransferase involved in cell wall biosynthesis
VRDGERYLGEAIESALAQTHPVAEVVIVDNASTDRSAEIGREFGGVVRVVEEPRPGIAHARSTAIATGRGDYMAFLDHDDLWEPSKTELQLATLRAEPELDFVLGHAVQFADDLDPELAGRVDITDRPLPAQHLGAMLATRASWERIGPWDGEQEAADGLVWFIAANQLGLRHRMLADVVLRRRIHGENRSFDNHEHRSEWTRALKASLDAKRARLSRPRPGGDRSDV